MCVSISYAFHVLETNREIFLLAPSLHFMVSSRENIHLWLISKETVKLMANMFLLVFSFFVLLEIGLMTSYRELKIVKILHLVLYIFYLPYKMHKINNIFVLLKIPFLPRFYRIILSPRIQITTLSLIYKSQTSCLTGLTQAS